MIKLLALLLLSLPPDPVITPDPVIVSATKSPSLPYVDPISSHRHACPYADCGLVWGGEGHGHRCPGCSRMLPKTWTARQGWFYPIYSGPLAPGERQTFVRTIQPVNTVCPTGR